MYLGDLENMIAYLKNENTSLHEAVRVTAQQIDEAGSQDISEIEAANRLMAELKPGENFRVWDAFRDIFENTPQRLSVTVQVIADGALMPSTRIAQLIEENAALVEEIQRLRGNTP